MVILVTSRLYKVLRGTGRKIRISKRRMGRESSEVAGMGPRVDARKAAMIAAARGTVRGFEYETIGSGSPGDIPNWLIGVIFLIRDEIEDCEKIVIEDGVIKIVRKTSIERFMDWITRKRSSGGVLHCYHSSLLPSKKEALPRAS